MMTTRQLCSLLSEYKSIDSHVHTHLCDGKADMTVENISVSAREKGISLVILTPHFHKAVSDGTETLYTDTDETVLLRLREEIDRYEKSGGNIKFLLSAEADVLSLDGEISLLPSKETEKALDLISPTLNYHPLLPLRFVKLTYGRHVDALHESGEYKEAADRVGGIEAVLETAYKTQINAVKNSIYPTMLGHFFMSVSAHPTVNNCFGARQIHLDLMKRMTRETVNVCKEKCAFIDLTGVHLQPSESAKMFTERNGFLTELHRFTVKACLENGVTFNYVSDAHSLGAIASAHSYYEKLI